MRKLIALVGKDVRIFRRDKVALALTFIIPFVMIVIFGFVFGGIDGDVSPIHIVVINHSTAPITAQLVRALEAAKSLAVLKTYRDEERGNARMPFTDSVAAMWIKNGKIPAALIIPEDALSDTSMGLKLVLFYDPRNEIESHMLEGILQQTIMTKVPSLFPALLQRSALRYLGPDSGKAFNGAVRDAVSRYFHVPREWMSAVPQMNDTIPVGNDSSSSAGSYFSKLIQFDRRQLVGEKVINPMVTRSIGGWAMMFVLFTLTAVARSIILERDSGTLHRLLSTPTTRGIILISKFVYSWLLGVVQLLVLFFFSTLIFDVDIVTNFPNLVFIILLSSAAATAFGMLLAATVRTSQQADALGMILILAMSAVGGSWFPVSLMPPFIQSISKFTLTYWSVEGFLNVLWRNSSFTALLPNMLVLSAISVGFGALSIWLFHRRETW